MKNRNYTPFQSKVLCQRGMYLAILERRLQQRDKDVGVENNLLNDLGFNLCVAPRSPVIVRGPLICDSGARSTPPERSCSRSNITI